MIRVLCFLCWPDRRSEDCEITFGSVPADWKMAASLKSAGVDATQILSPRVTASDFAALADSPIELSHFEEFTLHDLTPPVHVVIHGDDYKRRDVESALRKICAYEVKLMDGAPYPDYTFIFHIGKASGGSGGGMEHANSPAIHVPNRASLPNRSPH